MMLIRQKYMNQVNYYNAVLYKRSYDDKFARCACAVHYFSACSGMEPPSPLPAPFRCSGYNGRACVCIGYPGISYQPYGSPFFGRSDTNFVVKARVVS